jgi:hypothetical protein
MTASHNPWRDRFQGLDRIETIRARTSVPARPVSGLAQMSVEGACENLRTGIDATFVATDQCCQVLRRHIERAIAHSELNYPDVQSFLRRVYETKAEPAFLRPWGLVGLAGVGKTQVMTALGRVMPGDGRTALEKHHPSQELISMRRMVVGAHASDASILTRLGSDRFAKIGRASRDKLLTHVQEWFYSAGVSTLIVDEFQFLTQSLSANARIAQVLLMLAYLGVPWTFVANYSLWHRLSLRNHEDRQRLLGEPIVLRPEPPDSEAWAQIVNEYCRVAPGVFHLDDSDARRELHRLTAGLPRLLKELLILVYRKGRTGSPAPTVTVKDVLRASASTEYAASLKDVEDIAAIELAAPSAAIRTARRDLVSPFEIQERASGRGSIGDKKPMSQPAAPAAALVLSTLTPGARATLGELRKAASESASLPTEAAQVLSMAGRFRANQPSAEELLAGADLVQARLRRPTPSKESPGQRRADLQANAEGSEDHGRQQ